MAVEPARFEHQDRDAGLRREAVGENAAGGAGADKSII